ncbi:MAG: phosphatidylglycerophosphatase A [Rhodospirillales bacterium]|nr:phosphatidylglycerophosphatase A [Rhodospirillales bacterium]MCW8862725.1 phosphatidylglycerophosphatase A [Rhodospirillales bacterium]MCW8951744.1 phosphatidylglycerophosphatase A [Rhodospirillales bacterium]MCW9003419.1 phosphatidylglycerophosphatase A [Rhodospirillales bacterium]MCW9039606.1 phosphatidylglycerophosphatase A [Rhodospirillales bacterium]
MTDPVQSTSGIIRRLSIIVATWFGVGFLPKAPGTWGSLAALPLAWAVHQYGGATALAVCSVILFGIGWVASEIYINNKSVEDPSEIVVDEVVGQWITLIVVPMSPFTLIAGFVLFRVFDIFKPWPVSLADSKVKGGLGVMLDDVLAGIYAAATLFAISTLFET